MRGSGAGLGEGNPGRLAESDESFVQVLTPDGRFVDGTSPTRTPAIPIEDVRQALRGPTMVEHEVPQIDHTARMLARPVATARGFVVVVAGVSLEDRDDALSGLVKSFLIGGPIAVLLASGIGYLLASVGFRPVEAMRRRAEQISMARGGERLPLPDDTTNRRLGETLNEMLARLEASFEKERQFVADAPVTSCEPRSRSRSRAGAAIRTEQRRQRTGVPRRSAGGDGQPRTARRGPAADRARRRWATTGAAREVSVHELLSEAGTGSPTGRANRGARSGTGTGGAHGIDGSCPGRQAIGTSSHNALRHGRGAI